jgi:hypothetical protein
MTNEVKALFAMYHVLETRVIDLEEEIDSLKRELDEVRGQPHEYD